MEHKFKSYQPVIVRGEDGEVWRAAFFSHYFRNDKHDLYKYVCTNDRRYKQCLPAKGNRHLIGTTDSPEPPEPEFKFGDKVEVRDIHGHGWERAYFLCGNEDKQFPYYVYLIDDKKSDGFRYCRHATPPKPGFMLGELVEVRNEDDESWESARFLLERKDTTFGLDYYVFVARLGAATYYKQCRKYGG